MASCSRSVPWGSLRQCARSPQVPPRRPVVRTAAPRDRVWRGVGAVTLPFEPLVAVPASPYRGIQAFRYADRAIFFGREEETRTLARLIVVYRGVFLYGDSGDGKSSLVNAGLLPEAQRLGFAPVRVRVQPRPGEELVVERIPTSDDGEGVAGSARGRDR
jgi:hypothetical protein